MRKPIHPSGVWCSKCFGSHYTIDCPKVTPPKPLEARRQARIICDATGCGEWNCDDCHPETRFPKPLEPPQETEQCPRCYSAVRYVRLWISGFTGNCTNPWHDSPEPKPAPQADGFEDWWSSPKLSIDYDDAEDIAHRAWSAAQAPLLQKIAELEEKLRDTKMALEILATGVVEECSESLESEDLVAMAVRLAIDTARRERTGK